MTSLRKPLLAFIIGGLLIGFFCLLFYSFQPSSSPPPKFYLGGIQVNEPDTPIWIDTLQGVGMNTTAVTVYAKQGDWDSDHFWFEKENDGVLTEIREAKKKGLCVVLILRLALDHAYPRNQFLWHGMILPKSDPLLDSWFNQYTEFILHWARIAEAEKVDVLGVGSELNALSDTIPCPPDCLLKEYKDLTYYHNHYKERVLSFQDSIEQQNLWDPKTSNSATFPDYLKSKTKANLDWANLYYYEGKLSQIEKTNQRKQKLTQHWITLIQSVRSVYSGKLTYAANFDNYNKVSFWSHLDYIGINGYFKLRDNFNQPLTQKEMQHTFLRSWKEIFQRIQNFKSSQDIKNKPFIFTELGYTFRKNSTFEPWSYRDFSIVEWGGWKKSQRQLVVWNDQPLDFQERQIAIDMLHQVYRSYGNDFLRGILYWKLSTNPDHQNIEPFVLHIKEQPTDELQNTLVQFLEL